jgi:hypothetical protein
MAGGAESPVAMNVDRSGTLAQRLAGHRDSGTPDIRGLSSNHPLRLVGGSLVFVGFGLASVWMAMWAADIFAGRPTPVEPEAFKLVADSTCR